MPKFQITSRPANHRRKESNGWKSYRYGDQISLTQAQYDSGNYNHLGLRQLGATAIIDPGDETPVVQKPVKTDVDDTDAGNNEDDNAELTREQIEALLADVKDSKVDDGTFEIARDAIIEADLFESLPETKKGVIEALEALLKD